MMADESLSRLHYELIRTLIETGRWLRTQSLPPVSEYRLQSSKRNSARSSMVEAVWKSSGLLLGKT
jgi:hypothetical protein